MECPYCGHEEYSKQGMDLKGEQIYRCNFCRRKYTKNTPIGSVPRPPRMNPCLNCGKATTNPKFCSLSCSTTYNNIHFPKPNTKTRKQRYCKYCGVEITGRKTSCENCNPRIVFWDMVTLAEVTDRASYQIYARIRQRARQIYSNSDRPKHCINCGYDKHIEICHLRAIATFPPESAVSEINDLQNLVALCPNCHWELDNGVLPIELVQAKNASI